jgi:hypothetical protein
VDFVGELAIERGDLLGYKRGLDREHRRSID